MILRLRVLLGQKRSFFREFVLRLRTSLILSWRKSFSRSPCCRWWWPRLWTLWWSPRGLRRRTQRLLFLCWQWMNRSLCQRLLHFGRGPEVLSWMSSRLSRRMMFPRHRLDRPRWTSTCREIVHCRWWSRRTCPFWRYLGLLVRWSMRWLRGQLWVTGRWACSYALT